MSFEKFLMSAIIAAMIVLSGCNWFSSKSHASNLRVVNVLDQEYFDDCRIKTDDPSISVCVPFDQLEKYALENWDKENNHIVVYCANYKCTASLAGARQLKALGFKHVWAYEGGIAEWKHEGYPIEGPCAKSYLTDFAKPVEEHKPSDVDIISTQDLKQKIEEHTKTCC